MAQTPQQRKANLKFARESEARMGKAESEIKKKAKDAQKSPVPMVMLGLLIFVVIGGLLADVLTRLFTS